MTCELCSELMPDTVTECPHCGRPSLFPNVTAAARADEEAALEVRVTQAAASAAARGAADKTRQFADAIETAEAVANRYFGELFRLAWSDDQVYATYYQRVQAGLQIPESDVWNRLRAIADTIIFGDMNKASIRFATLSLNGTGLENYGDCALTLKTSMIAHRASVFEENAVIFVEKHDIRAKDKFVMPLGFQAPWAHRAQLCLAKLSDQIMADTDPAEFQNILLSPGLTSGDDKFVEVHIWGSLTIRSFFRVVVRNWIAAPMDVDVAAFRARLSAIGVEFVAP
jgi:hypothetical protein